MSITLRRDATIPAVLADDIEETSRSFPQLALDFCRRQPFGTFATTLNSMQSSGLDSVSAATRVIELAQVHPQVAGFQHQLRLQLAHRHQASVNLGLGLGLGHRLF